MTSPHDPDADSVDLNSIDGPPDVTVVPPVDVSADRTDPSRVTPAAGAARTVYDETHAAAPRPPALEATDADADVTRTAVAAPMSGGGRPSPAGVAVDRYVLRGFHAKGGLGEVHRAQDLELDREVAFKRMQAGYADDPGWREKFVAEARITARLDHPGVVPVFGLVADGHGRPCYAMRFIAGLTLRQEIDRFYGTSRSGVPNVPTPADPDARRVVFRQLLQRFIAVCQAVGFANSRGVVHRDLKPANVMVGEFGETLVVDWGLAKSLGDPPDAGAAADATAGTVTQPTDPEQRTAAGGRAVGTPAFMPPEQAIGSPDVGPAADVFGLGAVLFYLLTGRPPYSATDATATILLAQKAEYPRPRAVAAGTPPALDAVCVKAMAFAPADRYPTALDLAADVERWLSDEPVSAYRDPPAARAARWARRHPARVAAAVSTLLAGLVAAVVIAVVVYGKNDVIRDERNKAHDARDEAKKEEAKALAAEKVAVAAKNTTKKALDELAVEQKETKAAREVAETRFKLAQKGFGTLVGKVQDELDDRAGTQKLRGVLLEKAMAGLDDLVTFGKGNADDHESLRIRSWALLQRGDVKRTLGRPKQALADYLAADDAAGKLGTAPPAPRAGLADVNDRLTDIYLELGDVRQAAGAAKKAASGRPETPKTLDEIAAKAGTLDRSAAVALEEGQTQKATSAAFNARALREKQLDEAKKSKAADAAELVAEATRGLGAAYDRDAEVNFRVGDTAVAAKAADDAVAFQAAAAATSDRVGPRREWAAALSRKADVAADRADLKAELAAREQAVGILTKLAVDDPFNAAVHTDGAVALGRLGAARLRAGDVSAADADTKAACALADKYAAEDKDSARAARAVGHTRWDRGEVLLKAGKEADAVAEFAAAADVFDKLSRAEPLSASAARVAVEARERLAAARVAAGDPKAALGPLAAAIEVRRQAAQDDPAGARARRDLAAAYGRLSSAHLAAGNYAAAEDAAGEAAAGFRARAEADPRNLAAARDLAAARSAWGRVTATRGEQTATLILLHQARDGFDAVAAADKDSAAAAEEKAVALTRLADALGDADLFDFRLEYETAALKEREKVAADRPGNPYAHAGVVDSRRRLAEVYATARRYPDADTQLAAAKAVLAKFPDSPVLAAKAKAVAETAEVLAAARIATPANVDAVKTLPPPVRARVLLLVAEGDIQQKKPGIATWAAGQIEDCARGPDDLYRAAVVFARAASEKDAVPNHGVAAVKLLEKAADAGFRNPDLLRARWWDAVRAAPAFKAVETRVTAPPAK